jgi:hypothetical protein
MLFKNKYLEKFSIGMADEMVIHARNAATGVLAIWEVARASFYDQNIGGVVDAIKQNLHKEDLLSAIQLQPSERFLNLLKEQEYEILISKFFDFYWSRLPILFKCNRAVHHGKKRRPTEQEIGKISKICFKRWEEAYPDTAKIYVFSGDYSRFNKLTKWYAKSEQRDDAIYCSEWLWDSLRKLYPESTANDNVGNTTILTIKTCFPMFWDEFQNHYRTSLFYYANLGYFVGDLDTEELIERRGHC